MLSIKTSTLVSNLVDSGLRKIRIRRNDGNHDGHDDFRWWIPLESSLFFLLIQVKYLSWQDQAVHQLQCMKVAVLSIAY